MTLEERLAQKAQAAAAPAATPAPAANAPLSLEDRLRQKTLAGPAAPMVPPPPASGAGGGQTTEKPGFWGNLYNTTLRPLVENPGSNLGGLIGRGVVGIGELTAQPEIVVSGALAAGLGGAWGQNVEDLIRTISGQRFTTPQIYDRMFNAFLTQAAGSIGGDVLATVAQRFAARGSTSALEWLSSRGFATPTAQEISPRPIVGGAEGTGTQAHVAAKGEVSPTMQQVGPRPTVSPVGMTKAQVARKADLDRQRASAWQNLETAKAELPKLPPGEARASAEQGARTALSGTYRQHEGLRKAGNQLVNKAYADLDRAIGHPNNAVAPGELELRPAEFTKNAQGETVMSKPAIMNKTSWQSPVDTTPFRSELEEILEADLRSPFKAGTPLRRFIDALGQDIDPSKKGYNYIRYKTLKNALGKLGRYGDPAGEAADEYQGLAQQIVKNSQRPMEAALQKIADNAGMDFNAVKASQEAGDLASAKYWELFGDMHPDIAKAQEIAGREDVAVPGKTEPPLIAPGYRDISELVRPQEKLQKAAGAQRSALNATMQSEETWYDHLFSNPTNMDAYLSYAGPAGAKDALHHLIDHMVKFKRYGLWDKYAENHVLDRLTVGNEDLSNSLPSIFKQLQDIESQYGKEVASNQLSRALRIVGKTAKYLPVPGHRKASVGLEAAADMLENSEWARRVNMQLRRQQATLPFRARAGARIAGQMSAAPPAAPPLSKAAQTPPPPKREQMAGEQ